MKEYPDTLTVARYVSNGGDHYIITGAGSDQLLTMLPWYGENDGPEVKEEQENLLKTLTASCRMRDILRSLVASIESDDPDMRSDLKAAKDVLEYIDEASIREVSPNADKS